MSTNKKLQHLWWRAGFGPGPAQNSSADYFSAKETFAKFLGSSSKPVEKLNVTDTSHIGDMNGMVLRGNRNQLTAEQKAQLRKRNREGFKELNLMWLDEMTNSESQLREKMALFWHGHFACRVNNVLYQQELLHIIRSNALGNFKTLLSSVSRSAAMLSFLNNQQNRKKQPNENFARELMELFTLGRGNYSEKDVKESARAFTGWGFNIQGQFVFRQVLHDEGSKEFFGKKGNFSGDDIIEIILSQKQTARFLTNKIILFFSGTAVTSELANPLADRFYNSGYDIQQLLESIFNASWFYNDNYVGNKIKSPVEWLVGIRRTIPLIEDQTDWQLIMQKLLGQLLFFPPNVAGWPGGTGWIDSSTLMYRMGFPNGFGGEEISIGKPKADDDVQMGRPEEETDIKSTNKRISNRMKVRADWPKYFAQFSDVPRAKLMEAIKEKLLMSDYLNTEILEKHINQQTREDFIRSLTIRLMSTPDYQLC